MDIAFIKNNFKNVKKIPLRYADLDTLNHVNNATYLTFLDESRLDYVVGVMGCNFSQHDTDFPMVVANININYFNSIVLSDTLEIYTRCVKVGTKSFNFEHVFVVNDSTICAKADVVTVAVNEKGKSTTISDDWRQRINNFEC